MIKKILSLAIFPIFILVILGVGVYLLDQQFDLGFIETILNREGDESEGQGDGDTRPLEIQITSKEILTLDSTTSLLVRSNKEIEIQESEKYNLIFISQDNDLLNYVLEINNIGIGPATLKVFFQDKNLNIYEANINVVRENYPLPFGLNEIKDWENSVYTVDGDNYLAAVDKSHKLVEDYEPIDLVDLNKDKLLYTNSAGIKLRSEAADYLQLMLKDLDEATGKILVIASGYRSIIDQYRQYASWVRDLGQSEADKISARPGYSEHSLGTVVDFMSQDSGFTFTNEFDNTVAGKWLKENAYKYGYVQSYPQGREVETGYNYESWHYRFIGVENASEFSNSGVTLNEWLKGQ